jgi:YHS domain-containing protein
MHSLPLLRRTRRVRLPGLAALVLLLGWVAPVIGQTPIFQVDGVALRGYDVVSYFDGTAAPGSTEHTYTFRGAIWRFASAEHRARFMASPERYVPQYGGYCALGMAHGGPVPTDPTAFTVHNGRLYLNANQFVRTTWTYDRDWMIERADENWKGWEARFAAIAAAPAGGAQRGAPFMDRPAGDTTLALGGLDPVTYYDADGVKPGDAAITTTWRGKTWRFGSPSARERFLEDPERYAPQYGGLSPLILAHGDRVSGDPKLYTIINNRVYLDIAPGPQQTFRRYAADLIGRADAVWQAARAGGATTPPR